MNTQKIAKGWALIAEGAMELSLAYESIEPAVARTAATGAGGAKAGQPSSVPVLPTFDELPPEGWDAPAMGHEGHRTGVLVDAPETSRAQPPLKPQVDAGLGVCPVHGKHWTIKAAGVGKNGPYEAFWKCAESDDGVYCKQKPQKIWRDTHPAEAVAA